MKKRPFLESVNEEFSNLKTSVNKKKQKKAFFQLQRVSILFSTAK